MGYKKFKEEKVTDPPPYSEASFCYRGNAEGVGIMYTETENNHYTEVPK